MSQIETKIENIEKIPTDCIALDCDPDEVKVLLVENMEGIEALSFNGVAGIFESRYGISGTKMLLNTIKAIKLSNKRLKTIALGGEGVSASISILGPKDAIETFDYLSTAGGAGLEFWHNDKSFICLDSFPTYDANPIASGYANLMSIDDIGRNIKGKIVLLIADLNLEDPTKDDIKIRALVDDISSLKRYGAKKIIICSHRGRPTGKEMKYSMAIYAQIYTGILREEKILREDEEVYFVSECVGHECRDQIEKLPESSICVSENSRFYEDEKSKDKEKRKSHAKKVKEAFGAQILIFSAAGSAHRKDATKYYLPMLFSDKAIGNLMKNELRGLSLLRDNENRPNLAIIQGAKPDKLEIIKELFLKDMVDKMIILGKLAIYFYNGNELAHEIRSIAGEKLILPKKMTIARIQEGKSEKQFIDWLKTQK